MKYLVILIAVAFLTTESMLEAQVVALVKDGKPLFEILYPANSAPSGARIYQHNQPKTGKILAGILADYIEKSVGQRPGVIADGTPRQTGLAIHCGMTAYARGLGLPLGTFDSDEFVIAFPDRHNIVIAGKYQDGIEWGTYEFLERYFGVRWLFGGELGEHVPTHINLNIPTEQVREKPVFLSRAISFNNSRKELTQWAKRHRIRRRLPFSHNLGVLLAPRKYFDTNPEFYPVLNGQRIKPASLIAWQPCFTAPGIAQKAAANIIQYFKTHPDTFSYSLGLNDNGGHCECDACLEVDGDTINAIGRPDRSRSYYRFCTEVADRVTAALPGRPLKIGVIAYANAVDFPEGEQISPNIVPYLTTDGMRWLDRGIASYEQDQLKRWKNAVHEVGVYDYIYGGLYALPRIYFHHMSNYLRTYQSLGVKHYYAEAYIHKNFYEGPKYYLAMKLLWNPDRSPDQILKDWYESAVGPEAASSVEAYFGLWEDFWTHRIPKGTWFNKSKSKTYLNYISTGYYDDIENADFVKMEVLLRKAFEQADSDPGRERITLWLDGLLKSKAIVMSRKKYQHINSPAFESAVDRVVFSDDFHASVKFGNDAPKATWGTWKNQASFATFSLDPKFGHKAPGSLLIDKSGDRHQPTPANAVFMRQIPVKPGTSCRLTVWVHTQDIDPKTDPKSKVKMTVRWREKDLRTWVYYSGLAFEKSLAIKTDGLWQKLEMIVPVPDLKNIHYATILLASDARGGKIHFDDFEMTEVKDNTSISQRNQLMDQIEAKLKSGEITNLAPHHSFENISELKQTGYSVWPPKIRPSATLKKDASSDGDQCVEFKNVPVAGSINRFFHKVNPGEKYYVAIDAQRVQGSRYSLSIGWRDTKSFFPKDSPHRRSFQPGLTQDSQWQTIRAIVTVPPNAAVLVFAASVQPSPGDNDVVLFDNFRVCRLKEE